MMCVTYEGGVAWVVGVASGVDGDACLMAGGVAYKGGVAYGSKDCGRGL